MVRRGGFTLVEALIAVTLSSILVILVSTVFLVQNRYYALQLERTAAQDNARMVTEIVASELRSVARGGVTRAENKRLVVRSPMALAVVCGQAGGNRVYVQIGGGISEIATADVSGIALLNQTTGIWEFRDKNDAWNDVYDGDKEAKNCAPNGADTAGVANEFHKLKKLNSYFAGGTPPNGSVLMFYRAVEYRFDTSGMDPLMTALYRGPENQTLVEFATGMNTTAQFRYRTGGGSYATNVTGGALANIDAIRIEAQALRRPRTGGVQNVTYGWGVNVFLRNGG